MSRFIRLSQTIWYDQSHMAGVPKFSSKDLKGEFASEIQDADWSTRTIQLYPQEAIEFHPLLGVNPKPGPLDPDIYLRINMRA